MTKNLEIKNISFDEIVNFWLDNKHFPENKNILYVVRTLGPHKAEILRPIQQSYGLFLNDELIGVTNIVEWSKGVIRYRTIHIKKEYRKNDFGSFLLSNVIRKDWIDYIKLIGWVKLDHIAWSLSRGFRFSDGFVEDNHRLMEKDIKSFF